MPDESHAPSVAEAQPGRAAPRRGGGSRTWLGVLISLLVVGGGIAFIVADSLESARYYRTIPELKAEAATLVGQTFRVSGKVVPGSLETRVEAGTQHRFALDDRGQTVVVHYSKSLPDAFTDGVEVVVEGQLLASGDFAASDVLARCPSKYEAERTPESLEARHPSEIPLGQTP